MAYKPLKLLAKLASRLAYSGRRHKSRPMEDFRTEAFAAVALTVDLVDLLFRFVILGSPEKPKGPSEGALWQVWIR